MKIVQRDPQQLIPYENNPKDHPEDQISQIVASIAEWGFTQPLLVDERDVVLAGHGRLVAAIQLKLPSVPVVVAEGWTDAQKRAYIVADNKISQNGEWDQDLLEAELSAILTMEDQENSRLAKLTGFEEKFLEKLLESEDEDSPAPQPRTRGQELRIGRWHVECTEEEQGLLAETFKQYCELRGLKAGFLGWLCSAAERELKKGQEIA